MPTGNDKKDADNATLRVTALRFEGGRLVVAVPDGREISIPLARYPTLERATPTQREGWELIGGGRGVHWESLDLDLSAEVLIQGLPEHIPRPTRNRPPKIASPSVVPSTERRNRRVG